LKREVRSLHDDENESPAQDGTSALQFPQAQRTAAPSQSAQGAQGATAPADQQSQIDALRQQIRDLQRSAATDTPVGPGSAAEPQGPSSPAKLGFLLDSVMAKLPGATQDARIVGERYVRSQRRAEPREVDAAVRSSARAAQPGREDGLTLAAGMQIASIRQR